MNDAVRMRTICTGEAITLPGGGDVHLIAPPPKPCVTIVVHGVNDLAGCYERIERGLCEGLNERLDMSPTLPNGVSNPGLLRPAGYSLPEDDDGKASNPDAVYYRRKFGASANGADSRSVVIPFYWGFREEEQHIIKDAPHGEWMDRNKNRLDKAGTLEGGHFVNATTNLPDMWGKGFNGKLFGFISLDLFAGELTHPLFSAPGRRYMVLAAMRLAMLIRIIRKRYPNDTVNVVGHSQGTLITLLAHAFLNEDKVRPADGVVMINSPYSLREPNMEKLQGFGAQQTAEARLATLDAILKFMTGAPNPYPALSSIALKNCQGYGAIGGPGWSGGKACKTTIDAKSIAFNERDNRGSVYLYFTPQDQTVGLANVQGIGWQGVDEHLYGKPLRRTLPMSFHQRIFTLRKRGGEKELIGLHTPPYVYPLLLKGEDTWEDAGLPYKQRMSVARASLEQGKSVMLTAPLLPVPVATNFDADGTVVMPGADSNSGVYQVKDKLAPIDAAIAISNKAWTPESTRHTRLEAIDETVAFKHGRDIGSVQEALNEGKEISEITHVFAARATDSGKVLVTRSETPYEARLRLQSGGKNKEHEEALSFHSAIPNNPEHSRRVLAYDVAIGAGESVDDVTFYAYLCRVADWRLDWENTKAKGRSQVDSEVDNEFPDEAVEMLYEKEEEKNRDLIDATARYRTTGTLPTTVVNNMPSLVFSQTLAERKAGKPIGQGGEVI
ncbi:T6SS effector phospholipase Tle3 domain-containing protein [Pseudomonas protegens]|uniref:T6SS effector phospholipase Tle3 domain-containing protein n=1 Tax=Pseudomonas protegens TaxID=380021 RepID=UPI00069E1DC0|nr:DUF3274 domain-containing protein [Pseudomonas protegens]